MRALQERINTLEVDNEGLTRSLSAANSRITQEEAAWKGRLRDFSKATADTESILKARITALEEELKLSQIKGKEAAEQIKIAEGHNRVNQLEARRASEQLKLDRENWSLEKEEFTEKLSQNAAKIEKLSKRVAALEAREHLLVEQLAATEQGRKEAWDQATSLRSAQTKETTAAKKQHTALEAKLTLQCAALQRQVNSLETQSEKLQKLSAQRLEEANKLRKELQSTHKIAASLGRSPRQRPKSANRPGSGATTDRSNSSLEPTKDENELLRRIKQAEQELEAEDSLYHDLLLQSQDSRADLSSLRGKLDTVAGHMESVSKELLQLKRQQVEVARSRLGTAS
jgi:hypothetical protein